MSWLSYWFVPAFVLVGLVFAAIAAHFLFLGPPDERLVLSAYNLKIAVPAAIALWLLYSVLFWIGLGVFCWLIERAVRICGSPRT